MSEFNGYLFCKLHLIGTKSEGPAYYLQQFDYTEMLISKKSFSWEEDSELHKHLNTKVTIAGIISAGQLEYVNIKPFSKQRITSVDEKRLKVNLKLEADELVIPPFPTPRQFEMALEVQWPYRSIWHGTIPTTQIFDFFLEYGDQLIWQWSEDKAFLNVITPVWIPGGDPEIFAEKCIVDPALIKEQGVYTVRGLFIASGQEDEKKLKIKIEK